MKRVCLERVLVGPCGYGAKYSSTCGPLKTTRFSFDGFRRIPASVEGIVKAKTLSEGERAHLAEDGKVSIEQIPKAEVRIVASAAAFTKP